MKILLESQKMTFNFYLSATNGVFAIYVDNLIGNDSMYFIHKDYQGNMETVTSANGTILEKLSFDPWGRKRNPDNWTNTASTYHSYFDRGYTMHEHLPVFGIINMNGRLYDPWVGRMLSPDPFVQNPSSVQNYNRYSYALNNPLKYTDPSGYSYKPDDWDDPNTINHYAVAAWGSDGRGGAFDFSGVNGRANAALGIAYDNGYLQTYESIFNSFVEDNMPANTTLNSFTITDDGYWLNTSTVEVIPSPEAHLYSTAHMVNMISSFIPNDGSAGGSENALHASDALFTAGLISSAYGGAAQLATDIAFVKYVTPGQNYVRQAVGYSKVSTSFSVVGGVIGVFDNGYQAYNDFSNGNYMRGGIQAVEGVAYATGLGFIAFGGPPGMFIGSGIILVAGVVDLVEYAVEY